MGDGRGDVEGRQQGPITLSLVNRRLEEHDKDITRFRRPRTPSFSPPLAALLTSAAGARIGYARVSTKGQLLDQMVAALEAAGCARTFADKKSGKNAEREELWAALDQLRPGDTLVVPALDRLGRTIQDLISIVGGLRKREIGFQSLHEALDTTTPGGRLVFHVFAALAVISSSPIKQGCDLGGQVKDTVFDLAAQRLRGPVSTGRSLLKSDAVHWVRACAAAATRISPGSALGVLSGGSPSAISRTGRTGISAAKRTETSITSRSR
ncbi:recombinase family protein [Streptomyces nigrescens]